MGPGKYCDLECPPLQLRYNPPMPFKDVITPLTSSKTLSTVALLAMAMGIYSILPVLKENSRFREMGDMPSDIHAALSLVLGWLLVFRTNAAYARWWEARTLWGALVNATRNLSIKLSVLATLNSTEAEYLRKRLVDFPHALMCHLRQVPYGGDVYPKEGCPSHPPLAIANELYRWVAEHKKSRSIDGDDMRVIDAEMAKLMDVCGACERIARTPMVVSYRIFARQCIVLFLFTLPWGISNDFKWWTIPITIVIAYFMLGMEIVAEHVENPCGYDEDDLDLEGICDTIARSVNNIFHQSGLEVTPP